MVVSARLVFEGIELMGRLGNRVGIDSEPAYEIAYCIDTVTDEYTLD